MAAGSRSVSVLVVEDDADFAQTLSEIFAMEGHTTGIARSAEEALALTRSHNYDLTIIDVRLPGMSGIDLFIEIRRLRPSARCAVMTGYRDEALAQRAIDNGAIAVLRKPFDIKTAIALAG